MRSKGRVTLALKGLQEHDVKGSDLPKIRAQKQTQKKSDITPKTRPNLSYALPCI